jgi:hypothetical protein
MSDSERGAGWSMFAGMMLLLWGGWQVLLGFIALFQNDLVVATPNYFLHLDVSTWGWIHILGAILLILTGLGIFAGQTWARMVGVILAAVITLGNFLWLPYYPVWGITVIAIGVLTIWGLCVWSPPRVD